MSSEPRLDPQFEPILAAMADLPPQAQRSLDEIRAVPDASGFGQPESVGWVRDILIDGAAGEIPTRLYCPDDTPSALMVFFHGGGWVLGNLHTHDVPLRSLVRRAGIAVLSVDYRRSPEHRYPVPLTDCFTALRWASENNAAIFGHSLPVMVGGDSAGGNLAAATALLARDQSPRLAAQLLIYPSLDSRCRGASYEERGDCKLLTGDDMRWYWDQYISSQLNHSDPTFSPSVAGDLSELPPTIMAVAEFDPLRDECLTFGKRLKEAGNDVTVLHYPSLPHGFFNFLMVSEASATAFDEICAQVRRLAERSHQEPAKETT